MLLLGFHMIDGLSINCLSGLHIAVGRENVGSSVLAIASLFLGRLWLSRHKAKPLPNYHENVIGRRDYFFVFDAEYDLDNFVSPASDRRFERRRLHAPTISKLVRAVLN